MTSALDHTLQELREELEQLKAKYAASHQLLEMIIGHLAEGLIFIDLEGTIKLFNPAAVQLTGSAEQEVINRPYWDSFPDELFGFSLRENLGENKQHHVLLRLNEKTEVEVSTSLVPEKGLLLLLHDRTEVLQLEKSVHQQERLKELGEMAATLAHEIRNPLGGVAGCAQLLKRDFEENAMIDAIIEGTRLINGLITNVLDYARPLQLHFVPTDLVKLIKELLVSNPAFQKCHFKHDCATYITSIDRDRIKCVLLNLIRNGFEAGSEMVSIHLTKDGELRVEDRGCGITPEVLDKLFTPFFTTKTQGTGLGLAEASNIIKAHGGELTVTSELNKGTTFLLRLNNGH